MAFTPSDGTGLAAANSYADQAFADAYLLDRGVAAWASLTDADKEAALVRGTDYIDAVYGHRVKSATLVDSDVQALRFPTVSDGLPDRVKQAAVVAANLESQGLDLLPSVGAGARVKRERVEGAVEVEYFNTPAGMPYVALPEVDRLMRRYLGAGGYYGTGVKPLLRG